MAPELIEDPLGRQRLTFSQETDDDGGEVLLVEFWVEPGGGVPPHVHPAVEERFKVISGSLSLLAGRKWQTAGAGETVVVPPGTRHAYRNRGGEVAHAICEARPPSTLQAFLEEVAALARAGGLMRPGFPKSPRALLQAAAIAHRHREMVTLLPPTMPPRPLQRLLLPPLARLARRRSS
jgi:quercetin dioxygenase-like cupin family protein